ncbi:MAG: hypothetical protein ACYSU7_07125 [Planctomycetota bacterium]|jgi:hypothetical protein
MSSIDAQPHLRLVGSGEWWDCPDRAARRAVTAENRAAAANRGLNPTDPRWVLAARAYSQLQGTALTYERRQRVMRSARRLGVRPFDANLIIAIVQDQARRGRGLPEAAGTIALIEQPRQRSVGWTWARWIAAAACAVVANAFLIWWLTAG